MEYLQKYCTNATAVPNYQKAVNFLCKTHHKATTTPNHIACEFTGALYFPSHKLIICSYATNHDLYVDIHALSKSSIDATPGIPHVVLSAADGQGL